jgi:hypothetical protein
MDAVSLLLPGGFLDSYVMDAMRAWRDAERKSLPFTSKWYQRIEGTPQPSAGEPVRAARRGKRFGAGGLSSITAAASVDCELRGLTINPRANLRVGRALVGGFQGPEAMAPSCYRRTCE